MISQVLLQSFHTMSFRTQDNACRKRVGIAAQKNLDTLTASSRIPRHNCVNNDVQEVAWEHIHELKQVGEGGFCRVLQVHIDNTSFKGQTLALKCIKPRLMRPNAEKHFAAAASDLVTEGHILSKLDHENVIKIHAVCEGGPLQAFTENKKGYFLVLDLLEDTLSARLAKYGRRGRGRGMLSAFCSRRHLSASAVADRLASVAIGVARGLTYLHLHNIVLRDLKPDNIGFDLKCNPKIFDLGFARELHTIQTKEISGTLRYLAPEVALGKGFQKASDVYSFGLILWELCTLKKPFKKLKTGKIFMDKVVYGNRRPSLSAIKSSSLKKLIRECWAADPEMRPSMTQVLGRLLLEVSDHQLSRKKGWISHPAATSVAVSKLTDTTALLDSDLTSVRSSGPVELQNSRHGELLEVSLDHGDMGDTGSNQATSGSAGSVNGKIPTAISVLNFHPAEANVVCR